MEYVHSPIVAGLNRVARSINNLAENDTRLRMATDDIAKLRETIGDYEEMQNNTVLIDNRATKPQTGDPGWLNTIRDEMSQNKTHEQYVSYESLEKLVLCWDDFWVLQKLYEDSQAKLHQMAKETRI